MIIINDDIDDCNCGDNDKTNDDGAQLLQIQITSDVLQRKSTHLTARKLVR